MTAAAETQDSKLTNSQVMAALCAAQMEMPIVPKGGKNTKQNYQYSSISDYVQAIKPIMKNHNLCLSFTECSEPKPITGPKFDKHGKLQTEHAVLGYIITVEAQLIHTSGEILLFNASGAGYDNGDKHIAKAITAARKSLMAMIFNLETGVDNEQDDHQGWQQNQQQNNNWQQPPRQNSYPPRQQSAPPPPPQNPPANNPAPPQQPAGSVTGITYNGGPMILNSLAEQELGSIASQIAEQLAQNEPGECTQEQVFLHFTGKLSNGSLQYEAADHFYKHAGKPNEQDMHDKMMEMLRLMIGQMSMDYCKKGYPQLDLDGLPF